MAEVEMKLGKQMRITDDEKSIIKSIFHNNHKLLYSLTEAFLPEVDANVAFAKQATFYGPIDTSKMSPEEVVRKVKAINDFVKHIQVCMAQLWVLSDTPFLEMSVSPTYDERKVAIRSAFKGNSDALKLLRKVFYPELDPKAPFTQQLDMFAFIDPSTLSPIELWIHMSARITIINHVEHTLEHLEQVANLTEKTPEQIALEQKQNSTK